MTITCGADIGKRVIIRRVFEPPLLRRFAGSSVTEAVRAPPPPDPDVPRTPAYAPVPPMTAEFTPVWDAGEPGGAGPADSPRTIMLPTGFPEAFRISKTSGRIASRVTSPIALPGTAFGLTATSRE